MVLPAASPRERAYAGSGWQPWASRGGAVASQPSAVVYNGKTYLFGLNYKL